MARDTVTSSREMNRSFYMSVAFYKPLLQLGPAKIKNNAIKEFTTFALYYYCVRASLIKKFFKNNQ